MELNRFSDKACPNDIIGIAINDDKDQPHCGIVFCGFDNLVRLCDMRFHKMLGVAEPPSAFFWTPVNLEVSEVLQLSAFIEFIIEMERSVQIPYSAVYTRDAFDATARIRENAGTTCATFVVNIFEHFSLDLVDVNSWRARPKQDSEFRQRVVHIAESQGRPALAARLQSEIIPFRIKPWEVCGSATHTRHPVKFEQAKKLARIVEKLVRRRKAAPSSAIS